MTPCGPLADDWLFWDPETIFAYPHSREPCAALPGMEGTAAESFESVQLDLFHAHTVHDRSDT